MKTHSIACCLLSLPGTLLAQTATTDPQTLMSMGRFDEAKTLLIRNANQSPTRQTHFEAGYGYLRAGPDLVHKGRRHGRKTDAPQRDGRGHYVPGGRPSAISKTG